MDSFSYWALYISAVFALNITPGPDLLFILSQTVAKGQKIGFASSTGVCAGVFFHITAGALGVTAILASSAAAFSAVKYIGAAYLIYLGIKALFAKGGQINISASETGDTSLWKAFRQGMLTNIFNPKVALFFMAFIPQFVHPEAGSAALQFVILGLVFVIDGFIVQGIFVITAGRTTGFLRGNNRIAGWLNKLLGTVFISLGVRLALIRQS